MRQISQSVIGVLASFALAAAAFAGAPPVGSAFTYQGLLKSNGTPYTGTADFQFRLFESALGITQIGVTDPVNAVAVTEGVFTVDLDFGPAAFNGFDRWLEIAVHTPANGGAPPFTTLGPRQQIKPAPYALHALNTPFEFSGANAFFTGGNVGIGTLSPSAMLHVTGSIRSGNGTDVLLQSGGVSLMAPGNDQHTQLTQNGNDTTLANTQSGSLHLLTGPAGPAFTRMTVNPSGLVGINTITPAERLHVVGDLRVNSDSEASTTLGTGVVNIMNVAGATGMNIDGNEIQTIGASLDLNPDSLTATSINGDAISVLANGRVGLGVLSPVHRFEAVSAESGLGEHFEFSSSVDLAAANDLLSLQATATSSVDMQFIECTRGASTVFIVNGDGAVGIGTTSPTARLHITGVAGTDGIRFPDGTLQVTAAHSIIRATVAQPNVLVSPGGTTFTLAVPGATGGSVVSVSYGAELGNMIIAWARVNAANSVQVRIFNTNSTISSFPASSWNIAVTE